MELWYQPLGDLSRDILRDFWAACILFLFKKIEKGEMDVMETADRIGLDLRLNGLVIFRNLLEDPAVKAMRELLETPTQDLRRLAQAYGNFAALLFEKTTSWSRYLFDLTMQDENLYVKSVCGKEGPSPQLTQCLERELKFLEEFSRLTGSEALGQAAGQLDFLPSWRTSELDFKAAYENHLANVQSEGYGIFARYHVFTVEDGRLVPVKYPDPQRLSQLPGYEKEREKVVANTLALLRGEAANNVLLYGDAGTGKSSAVKAIANEYFHEGLRLVEVKKNQLYQIPELVDGLAANPLKFILFIDDLSFTANDDNFAALKAILEGSVGGRSKNIAVYATSNRRHLIKETLSDREGDDIHHGDTMQELMSLSARFGLTITFSRPDKERFVAIVRELAAQYGVDMPEEKLIVKAEAFAIRAGGRSPRVAKQFIELVKSGVPV